MGRIRLESPVYLRSEEETLSLGRKMANLLPSRALLALSGDLGAGKTTFVKGLAEGLGIQETVQSPTFVLLHLYERIAHFDLYRLKKSEDFLQLGFADYFDWEGISVIEWAERIQDLLPPTTIYIDLVYNEEGGRIAHIRS